MLDEIKTRLAAYPVRDRQHFNHLLQMFEGIGADLPTIRRVVQESIDAEKRRRSPLRSGKNVYRPETPPAVPCPSCGKLIHSPPQKIEELAIIECPSCRWSAIVGEAW
jgi:DNA-directed RNA polymerase subunit RPC12/RpoP